MVHRPSGPRAPSLPEQLSAERPDRFAPSHSSTQAHSFTQAALFLLDKPAGISSAQAIARVRRRLGIAKIGHAGTLDPFATGLLIILANGATRCMDLCLGGTKVYSGTIQLGARSSTDDGTGELMPSEVPLPTDAEVQAQAQHFLGDILQVPPQISAVHVDGERAYRRARRGEVLALSPRSVCIEQFEVAAAGPGQYSFRVRCSSGTYIRSLARDLGDRCGCGGYLARLRREVSEPFSVAEAASLEEVTLADRIAWSRLVPEAQRIALLPAMRARLAHGQLPTEVMPACGADGESLIFVAGEAKEEVALVRFSQGRWNFVINGAASCHQS